jgi:putative membrane protein
MRILFLIFFSGLFALAANAQQSKKSTTKKAPAKKTAAAKPADGPVIMKTYYDDLMEVELGGYAEKYAADQRVKDLGSTMVRDHRRTKIELKSIASQRNMTIPETMDTQHQGKTNELEKKKGTDFDKQYVDMLVSNNAKNLSELRRAQTQVRDKALKDYMPKLITLAQTHLDSARVVQAHIKGVKK